MLVPMGRSCRCEAEKHMWFAVSAEPVGQNILINNSENKKYRRYGCTGESLYSRIFVRIAKNASLLYNDKMTPDFSRFGTGVERIRRKNHGISGDFD